MTGYIERLWIGYRDKVIPKGAGHVQLIESKRAFFAGARSLLDAVMIGLDEGTEPTDADMARMDAIQAELDAFARSGGLL